MNCSDSAENRLHLSTSGAVMKAKSRESRQGNFLYPDLLDQLNPAHPLLKLAKRIPWQRFEDEFAGLYSQAGRPAKPIRLMVGLILLKQLET